MELKSIDYKEYISMKIDWIFEEEILKGKLMTE
jgi:hypothetical protein